MIADGIRLNVWQTREGKYIAEPTHPRHVALSDAQPTKAHLDNASEGLRWEPWGEDDKFPANVREKLEKVPMAMRAIKQLVEMMYGNGLVYVKNSLLNKAITEGRRVVPRSYDSQIESWLAKNRIATHFLPAVFTDYRIYMNAFCELIYDRARRKVAAIYHKPAEHCRLSRQNKRTLDIEYLIYSPDFSDGYAREGRYKQIPLYRWYDEDRFFRNLRGYKFAMHVAYPSPGRRYYAQPFWVGLFRDGGWLDVSANVPEIVNAMQRNQVTLKYQIQIPESYFQIRYKNEWHNYTDEQRQQKIDELIKKINDYLSGTQNVHRSISYVFRDDPQLGDRGKINIEAVDDKAKKGAWIPDSQAADAQIVQGLGLHPSQIGLQPEGGKMGAGSGSDQRETYNIIISTNNIDQNICLEPLNLVSRLNGWDVTFFIDHTWHTTTNRKEDGLEPGSANVSVDPVVSP